MASQPLLIDVHTHMYPPSYMSLLSSRTSVPYVAQPEGDKPAPPRLVILPTDDNQSIPRHLRGRPISEDYSSVARKLAFMRRHGIRASVISLANPWLDWVSPDEALSTARRINNEFETICAETHNRTNPSSSSDDGVLYHFATLPLSAPMADLITSISELTTLKYCRGIILGTTGLGSGLDDPALSPLWSAIERTNLMIFIHPHYGLSGADNVFGTHSAATSGHVLPLALGFPMETTIAFTRMYLAGVFTAHPALRVLLAHSGGTLPFLAGRIESCVLHERAPGVRAMPSVWDVLRRNVWLDGVVYNAVGLRAAIEAVGEDRVLWGTDHPFFPPVEEDGRGDSLEGGVVWESVSMNVKAAKEAFVEVKGEDGGKGVAGVLGGNAVKALGLELD